MNRDEELDEQINNYIRNKMDDEERALFEARLASDQLLQKEVEQCRVFNKYYDKNIVELRKSIREAELRYLERTTITKRNTGFMLKKRTWWLAIAASIIVIAGIFYFTRNQDYTELAKENSLAGYNKSSVRRGDSIEVADVLFHSGQYRQYIGKAITLLKEIKDADDRSILHINICKSYIQLDEPGNALLFYQSLTEEEKEECYLQYQAALAYTILKNNIEATRLFNQVKKSCFPVNKDAAEWIKKLQ